MELNEIFIVLMFASFIGLLFTGMPIAYVLGGVSIAFTAIGQLSDTFLNTDIGLDFMILGMVADRIFQMMSNWILVAIPMFVFMGLMLDRSAIAEDMMLAMQRLFGRVRGGLAITVTFIGVIMAATTGVIGASVVLMALLSLPTMLEQGYDKSIATGTICASGTLGILIPPSIMLVVMADQLAISVADLFMGALIPGLILSTLYVVFIFVYGLVKPEKTPLPKNTQEIDAALLWQLFKSIIPPSFLIFVVLGSIFAGLASPTEASGMGAAGAMLLALCKRKLSIKTLKDVCIGTYRIAGFIFGIWISATLFALVMRLLGGDELIEHTLMSLPFGTYGVVIVLLLAVFFLGFFLDWIEICLIILPLLGPVLSSLSLNMNGQGIVEKPELVWFTVLVAVTLQTSFLTPPVGPAIFYLQGVAPPGVKLIEIYKGVIPFILLQLLGIIVVLIWPKLVLWLPIYIYG